MTFGHLHTSNSLIHETSPYLLQHAHNPVNWYAWTMETLDLARKENKPILVSIGYSACHWCHVMEKECFEDAATAAIMNELFINIKVDREERPDIDQVYMNAVQLMTGHGGWPLNCFIMPDGRPFYGGTYFQKEQWQNILQQLGNLWKNEKEKLFEYASQLTAGIKRSELVSVSKEHPAFSFGFLQQTVNNWKQRFDTMEGGPNRAPKFPLPNNYLFLLRFAQLAADKEVQNQVDLTLKKMAFGGLHDQLGGGFSRYSTDMLWKVPHFEKMLYDNAQLVSLYSEAFQASGNVLYKEVVYETIRFVLRELSSPEGAFYSSIDADSEGEEGKYYVWTKEELQTILGNKYELAADYFSINSLGYWENNKYILLRSKTEPEEQKEEITAIRKTLLAVREKRPKPGLDDKSLTSWNALMLAGLVDAYRVFNENEFLISALKNATFICSKQLKPDGGLYHTYKNGRSTINGFLEDYASTIESFISLYQCNFDEKWLNMAKKIMDFSIAHFYDGQTGLFYFTSDTDSALITRKTETSDNVMPASCSSIAQSLFKLGHYFAEISYIEKSKRMLHALLPSISQYGEGYSNWCVHLLHLTSPFYEVAIVGKDVDEIRKMFSNHYLPNVIFAGSHQASSIPILLNRFTEDKTLIYVCENNVCRAPVENFHEALYLLQEGL